MTLIKGLFQETLERFLFNFDKTLRVVLHLDADLFSSTLYVLTTLNRFLSRGDIMMLDDFSDPLGEFRAYLDYSTPSGEFCNHYH